VVYNYFNIVLIGGLLVHLNEATDRIAKLDYALMKKAQERLNGLTKPIGSLGKLEDMVVRIVGITEKLIPDVNKKAVVIMCSDNGVVEEGVTQAPKEVTASVARNFMKDITGINVFSKHAGAEIFVVDIGIDDDINCNGIIDKKIRKGTCNIAKKPAMTREEAVCAIETGISIVGDLKGQGFNLLGTGEMGIGNTTTSSAVSSVLTGEKPETMVGRGAGLTSEGLKRKVAVVKKAIEINSPDRSDAVDVLAKLGGFDIAGLAGCFIGAAVYRIPILIDGFISATAALAAVKIKPEVKEFIFPSHGSAEPGNKKVMELLELEPVLNLNMRLGEGSGAALGFHIIDAAVAAYKRMGTFEDAQIDRYKPLK
jgi:nicotinate-nucleotide--dimethylbenzimidazole phosphoribosyltransferase